MVDRARDFEQRTDQELLELLLRSGDRAAEIVRNVPLDRLAQAHRNELRLTHKEYERLLASIEIGRRIHEAKAKYETPNRIQSTSDAIDFCRSHFARLISDCLQEQFHIVSLDTKHHVIGTHHVTTGTLDASLVHPREVFRLAIKDAASSINHVSLG